MVTHPLAEVWQETWPDLLSLGPYPSLSQPALRSPADSGLSQPRNEVCMVRRLKAGGEPWNRLAATSFSTVLLCKS